MMKALAPDHGEDWALEEKLQRPAIQNGSGTAPI